MISHPLLRRGFTPGFRSADLISLFSLPRFPQSSGRSCFLQKAMLPCPSPVPTALLPRGHRCRGSLGPPPPSAGACVQCVCVCVCSVCVCVQCVCVQCVCPAPCEPGPFAPSQQERLWGREAGMRLAGWVFISRPTSAECGKCCVPRAFRWNTVPGAGVRPPQRPWRGGACRGVISMVPGAAQPGGRAGGCFLLHSLW